MMAIVAVSPARHAAMAITYLDVSAHAAIAIAGRELMAIIRREP